MNDESTRNNIVLDEDDRIFIKRILREAEKTYNVLESKIMLNRLDVGDFFTIRYCIIELIESIAIISSRIAGKTGYSIEGYIESMRFLVKQNIIDKDVGEKLVRLARLRNLLVHRYWEIDDYRIVREARGNGLNTIRRVLNELYRLVEE